MFCFKCNTDKDISEFHLRSAASIKQRQNYCKSCRKAYDHEYHLRVRDKRIAQKKANREERRKFILNYLLNSDGCIVCGEKDPIVLEFDHLHSKKFVIGDLTGHRSVSIETLKNEVEKCQILCANCHRRKTAKDFGYYRAVG